jgi:hypothetical protein
MKIIKDYQIFEMRTQPIEELDSESIDLVPDAMAGLFWPKRLKELIEFCKKNPIFHIMSIHMNGHVEVNTLTPGASFYRLAKGDNDPELTYTSSESMEVCEDLDILKPYRCS